MADVSHDTEVAPDTASSPPAPAAKSFDVLIVGGGLSGSIAAAVLGQAGYQVGLIDRFLLFPPQFRVEKVNGATIGALQRFGLFDRVAAASTYFDRIINVRHGQVLDETHTPNYGIMYHDLVQAIRAQLPASVDLRIDRVVDVETSADRQRVTLASGDRLEARLLILATGMSTVLSEKLGVQRPVVSEKHSITFGFSIAPAAGETFDFQSLTYYGEARSDRVDYLTLFPIGKVMRANLFTFRDDNDPWIGQVVRDPKATLLETLPGLGRFLGDFQVVTRVESWMMNLCQSQNIQQDGVVIIGDAFQTSCPSSGLGCARLVSDVERLCTAHIPRWMSSEGMGAEKIGAYYDDHAKQSFDHLALKSSRYRRALTMDTGIRGAVRRQREFLPRRLKATLLPTG